MGMDHRYTVLTDTPGERLAVHIESRRGDELTFDATLALRRRELTPASAGRVAARYPFANLRVLALIYGHALGLVAGRRPGAPASEGERGVIGHGVIDRAARWILSVFLRRIRTGTLTVVEGGQRRAFGSGPPAATIVVRSAKMWRMALRGSRGLAEAYADGLWDSPDLTALVRLAARNASGLDRLRAGIAPVRVPIQRARARLNRNTRSRRRRDIAAHYDLGNELFSRMLDPTMSYSCAVFDDAGMPLEEAQLAKLELICDKLALGPDDHLLEIGTGWGGAGDPRRRHPRLPGHDDDDLA